MRRMLILNLAKSPGLKQHIQGLDEAITYIVQSTCCSANESLIKISDISNVLRLGRAGDSLLIFAPHFLSPLYALVARLRGIHVFHWLHEPAPLQFLASNLTNHSYVSRLKILFLACFYNPLSIAIATDVVLCSKYALSSLQCSLLGLFVAWARKPVHFCPLPYPTSLAFYSHPSKKKGIAVCGSLNTDKGADLLLHIVEKGFSLPINILCTSSAYRSNIFIRRLSEFPSVQLFCKETVDDHDIYSHISEASHVFLGYKAITQSGLLPIALAVGTEPVVTHLPSFACEFWNNPSLISVLPESIEKAAVWLGTISHNPAYGDSSIPYFLDGQVRVIEFLSNSLGFEVSVADRIALAYRNKLSSLYLH